MLARPSDRWFAAGAIWGPGLFIMSWLLAGFMVSGYSPFTDHISSLAAVDAPSRMLMNLGFAAFAVGVGTAAWPLRRVIGNAASVALALNALFVFGVMLTPEGRSAGTDFLHGGFASLVYLSLVVSAPLAALTFRRRGLSRWAMVSFAVGLATAVFLIASNTEGTSGLFQRL
ncbi:MAG: DUF998 domain-containing protein, partial [Actinomycetota bacterium]|nr:DUF998 domain-containing protein [Actinomycetota bacterium]